MSRLLALALAALASVPLDASAGLRPAYGGTVRVVLPTAPREPDPARAHGPADAFLVAATAGALLEVDEDGNLGPGLLAEVPRGDALGHAFQLRLREGLRRPDGAPFTAGELARSIARLLSPASSHAWAALPIAGADAVLDGREAALSGLRVLSETELLVTLAFPFPELPDLLAAAPLAARGMGPFLLPREVPATGRLRLVPNGDHALGRPYADALELVAADARRAGRLLEAGEADVVLRPEPHGRAVRAPGCVATVAALNAERLGPAADGVRRVLAALDRAELARGFVRGPSLPLERIVPPAPGDPSPLARSRLGVPRAPERVTTTRPLRFLVDAAAPDQAALAARIQVKLFDRGVRARVEAREGTRFSERLAGGDYDVALVSVPLVSPSPSVAAGQIAFATRGPAAVRGAMAALAGLARADALLRSEELGRELDLVPLVATGLHASLGPGVELATPGDLWLVGGGAPSP